MSKATLSLFFENSLHLDSLLAIFVLEGICKHKFIDFRKFELSELAEFLICLSFYLDLHGGNLS